MANAQEGVVFEEMKERVKELNLDDHTILRFLRARNFDLNKAEVMLRADVEWREENNISSYLEWTTPTTFPFDKNPIEFMGHDYEGHPVLFVPYGRFDSKSVVIQNTKEDCEAFSYNSLEIMMHHVRNSGNKPMTYIGDFNGFKYLDAAHIPTLRLYQNAFSLYEKHYPEILGSAFLVNASWLFPYCFNFLKPILTGTTMSKIKIFDRDQDTYIKALLEVMPESCIPDVLFKDD